MISLQSIQDFWKDVQWTSHPIPEYANPSPTKNGDIDDDDDDDDREEEGDIDAELINMYGGYVWARGWCSGR